MIRAHCVLEIVILNCVGSVGVHVSLDVWVTAEKSRALQGSDG